MIRAEYRCPDCAKEFVFLRRIGFTTSPQQFTTSPQWSRGSYPSPRHAEGPVAVPPPVAFHPPPASAWTVATQTTGEPSAPTS